MLQRYLKRTTHPGRQQKMWMDARPALSTTELRSPTAISGGPVRVQQLQAFVVKKRLVALPLGRVKHSSSYPSYSGKAGRASKQSSSGQTCPLNQDLSYLLSSWQSVRTSVTTQPVLPILFFGKSGSSTLMGCPWTRFLPSRITVDVVPFTILC